MFSAMVYNQRNQLTLRVPPKKITSRSTGPCGLQPGMFRVDLLFDDRPIWRTFFTIND
jgi:hypothetical protein